MPKSHDLCTTGIAGRSELVGVTEVLPFRTTNVVFLLIPEPRHRDQLRGRPADVGRVWGSQIEAAQQVVVLGASQAARRRRSMIGARAAATDMACHVPIPTDAATLVSILCSS